MATAIQRPLQGLRVVDAVRGPLAPMTRYLAELGARVDRTVTSDGVDDLADLTANMGKIASTDLSPEALATLIDRAHMVVEDVGLEAAPFRARNPALVWMTVSAFGSDNRYSHWRATDLVLHALSGELSRSGVRGRPPLPPPGELAFQCAATQGAYLALAASYEALRTGLGDHFDFAALDGAIQALDPGFGIGGSATLGRPARELHRGRPVKGVQYPILPCADGRVRICLLAVRQWRGMFRWMGEPPAFAAPEFEQMIVRYKSPDLLPAIAAFFADKPRATLEREGQAHGVPIAGLLSLAEFMRSDTVEARGALGRVAGADGRSVEVPNGVMVVDGERMGSSDHPHTDDVPAVGAETLAAPFDGLRVLDLGVIVVGAEASRLFADGGADVVKVESAAFPDGNRQSYLPYGLSVSFAAGHRNKRSLGIDIRSPEGRSLFLRLAARADVILSNFKPGTLESLGIGYDEIAKVRPEIIMVDSSAYGAEGPWSKRLGYGPLVRASTGLTQAWRYPDDPEGFSDSVTIYPDHAAGRVSAMGVIALLIRRLTTGRGGIVSIAQSEVMLAHAATSVARLSLGQPEDPLRDAPWGVFKAAGEDDFAVVTVRDQAEWEALARVLGREDWLQDAALSTVEGRRLARAQIDHGVALWCAERAPSEIAEALQAVGVPAAPMLRVGDQLDFDYFHARELFRRERHPFLSDEVISERRQMLDERRREPPSRAAPLSGENSVEVVRDWIGLTDAEALALTQAGVLEPTPVGVYDTIARTLTNTSQRHA